MIAPDFRVTYWCTLAAIYTLPWLVAWWLALIIPIPLVLHAWWWLHTWSIDEQLNDKRSS